MIEIMGLSLPALKQSLPTHSKNNYLVWPSSFPVSLSKSRYSSNRMWCLSMEACATIWSQCNSALYFFWASLANGAGSGVIQCGTMVMVTCGRSSCLPFRTVFGIRCGCTPRAVSCHPLHWLLVDNLGPSPVNAVASFEWWMLMRIVRFT